MSRMFGTVVRGVRAPIFREGDDVVKGTVDTVLKALKENSVEPHDKDVVAITESVVARTQGNYATVEQIAADVKARTGGKTVGVTFPILSRNRFSVLLSGIAAGCEKVVLMLDYTDTVITCDIHTRARSKRLLQAAGARVVLGLDDLMTAPVAGSGYNAQYGLLGSNKADENRVKLFPRDAMLVAEKIGQLMSEATGHHIEAMVYGDGAFKDPAGKIWELADPVVAPGYTKGLIGTPNELKLKYLADHDFGDLSGTALQEAITQRIKEKDSTSLVGNMVSEGTTPRNLTDLIGSLCDLTSGSGDKGTPIIYIQGYFDNSPTE